jgi:transcription antitermination factor NusG
VARVITGQEKKIKAQMEIELERAGLTHHVPQILIPTEKVYTVKNGKKLIKEKAYLPGYILIQAEIVGEVGHIIDSVNGVVGFLGGKSTPVPLRANEVARILGNVDQISENDRPLSSKQFVAGCYARYFFVDSNPDMSKLWMITGQIIRNIDFILRSRHEGNYLNRMQLALKSFFVILLSSMKIYDPIKLIR